MKTLLSSKGQMVLPAPIRRRLGMEAGEKLDARIEGDRIVLVRLATRRKKARIVADPETGLPTMTCGPGTPKITSAQVAKLAEDLL